MSKLIEQVTTTAQDVENAQLAVKDLLVSHYNMLKKVEVNLKANDRQFVKEKEWSASQLNDLQDSIDVLKEKKDDINNLLQQSTAYDIQRFQKMRKCKADALIEENRLKRRKTGEQGRPELIDEEVEEFMLKAIEEKATYHGRRTEATMFVNNRRVKVRDLKNIANANLLKRGKEPIQSSVTAWNRSKPRNIRSIQAKRHKGKMLFFTRKPPKMEDNSNESTHYQRAHKKNVVRRLFSKNVGDERKYSFARSIDDKAYVRPGTCEGFEKTRNKRILTPSADERARKLPKYDWPEKKSISHLPLIGSYQKHL